MRRWVIYGCIFLLSCGTEPTEVVVSAPTQHDTSQPPVAPGAASDTDISFAKNDVPVETPPAPPPVKRPAGVYRFLHPFEDGRKVLHTISFSPNSFRLQEEYPGKSDSIVVTTGTWAPSAGYIWLYRDQVVRARYAWKGDTLQYYSPQSKRAYPLEKLSSVTTNEIWQTKKREGALLYAIGNEPFWSVEVNKDTIVLNMPDWNAPLRTHLASADITGDSTVYKTMHDSLQITVYPFFCNDGMSDFLYTKKVKLVYKGQTYKGCGERFHAAY